MQARRALHLKTNPAWFGRVRFQSLLVLACLVLGCGANAANRTKAPTHCNPNEKVVFSCPFKNGKTVSLCGSADLSKDTGTLQYRFGRVGRALELSYPKPAGQPKNYFWYWEADAIFPARATYVGFDIGSKEYSLVISEAPNTEDYTAYLKVQEKKKEIVNLQCPLSNAQNFVDLISDVGLPEKIDYAQKRKVRSNNGNNI